MKEKKDRLILITGGHFTAAIGVLEELKSRGYSRFLWVGHKYTMLKDKEPSAEYKEVTKLGISFLNITTGKLYRYPSFIGVISLLRIPIGFLQSIYIILSRKPDIVLSFGGYIALPIAIVAFFLRVPVVTHEQTTTVGLSNQVIGKVAKKIMIAWPESAVHFPSKKTVFTGNPVRSEIYVHDRPFVGFKNQKPTILVMGGNQGSHDINVCIEKSLPMLTDYYNIIHQTGSNTIYRDYERLFGYSHKYPNYKAFKGIWGEDIGRALSEASLCISRSGANTIYELAILKKPSVLIPLPYAVNNEQMKNAQFLEKNNLAVILPQANLSTDNLLDAIQSAIMLKSESGNIVLSDATVKIADVVESI